MSLKLIYNLMSIKSELCDPLLNNLNWIYKGLRIYNGLDSTLEDEYLESFLGPYSESF